METPGNDSERTQLAMSPFGPETEGFPDLLAPAAPSAPVRAADRARSRAVGPGDDGVQWYMALDGNRTGPFTRSKLVDKLAPLAKSADVHIWNEKLDGWKPPAAVPEIAAEISRRAGPRRRRRRCRCAAPTPPPMPPLASGGLPHGQPARKPTGPHAPPSPIAHASVPAGRDRSCRRRAAFIRRWPPRGARPRPAADRHRCWRRRRPSRTIIRTHGKRRTARKGHAPPKAVNSDVMQMLNMPGGTQTAPGAPPRLMSVTDATGWAASAETQGPRQEHGADPRPAGRHRPDRRRRCRSR